MFSLMVRAPLPASKSYGKKDEEKRNSATCRRRRLRRITAASLQI
jgi:hypothetical protein